MPIQAVSFSNKQRQMFIVLLGKSLFHARYQLAQLIAQDMHKPVAEALQTDLVTAISVCEYFSRPDVLKVLKPHRLKANKPGLMMRRVVETRRPYGVVGVISPWNYPLGTPVSAIVQAIAAGNAVVWKPSEYAPRTSRRLVELINETLVSLGQPPGLVTLLEGDGLVGQQLVDDPDIPVIVFTGSTAVGQQIRQRVSHKKLVLELGGSDPCIILPGVTDLPQVLRHVLWARMANAGQTCAAVKRLWVPQDLYQTTLDLLAPQVAALRVGPPEDSGTQVGPLVNARQQAQAQRQLAETLAQGARVVAQASLPSHSEAFPYVPPTLVADVPPGTPLATEEVFAPILPVFPYDDLEAVLAHESAHAFSLGACVFGPQQEAMAVAARLPVGQVAVNDTVMPWYATPEVPWVALGKSGQGVRHSPAGLLELTIPQVVVENPVWERLPLMRQAPWLFPKGPVVPQNPEADADALLRVMLWPFVGSGQNLGALPRFLRQFWDRG